MWLKWLYWPDPAGPAARGPAGGFTHFHKDMALHLEPLAPLLQGFYSFVHVNVMMRTADHFKHPSSHLLHPVEFPH